MSASQAERPGPRPRPPDCVRGHDGVKTRSRKRLPGSRRVAPLHVRNGLAGRGAMDGVWCAGANRVDTTRLAGARGRAGTVGQSGVTRYTLSCSRACSETRMPI